MASKIKVKTDDSTAKAGEGLAQTLEALGKPLVHFSTVAIPFIIVSVSRIYGVFLKLPQNALHFIFGLVICFFGGTFPTLFAALKAAEFGGRKAVAEALTALSEEALIIIEESKKDDSADEDKDGIRDVDQVGGQELLRRKFLLVLKKINPQKVNDALGAIYKVWLAVMAVLSIQFARTVSLSLTISSFLEMPCKRVVQPAVSILIPKDYKKWVPVVLGWICKSIAISLAWSIQSVISAAASSLDGGLMMARSLYAFCLAHKIKLFGLLPDNHEDTAIDELLSYLFAGLGFYFQFKMAFDIPFPLNLVLWPFNLVEFYIRWSIE
jgi:hypothetical protein